MNIHQILETTIAISIAFINKIGYLGIFIGMFLESTLFPIPSELIMIPAGLAAAKGDMNLFLVIFFGVLGNVFGAIFSFYLAFYAGRKILFKIGRFFFVKEAAIIKIENFFKSHGEISVFIGRLLVGFRHFISLPAGVAKMNIAKFIFYTTFGSAIWTSILAILGFLIGSNQELINQYLSILLVIVIVSCSFLVAIYIFIKRRRDKAYF